METSFKVYEPRRGPAYSHGEKVRDGQPTKILGVPLLMWACLAGLFGSVGVIAILAGAEAEMAE